MEARYLYGDSDVFPDGYDVLRALRGFVEAASQALVLMSELDAIERDATARTDQHVRDIEALSSFYDGVVNMVAEQAARSPTTDLVAPVARDLVDHVEAMEIERRERRARDLEGEQARLAARARERREALGRVVSHYLHRYPPPVERWRLSLQTEPAVAAFATVAYTGGVTVRIELDPSEAPTWSKQPRLGQIAPETRLHVGQRKGFLRSTKSPEITLLDDMLVAGIEVDPETMELRLRRRADAPDEILIRCRSEAGVLAGEVRRGDESLSSPPEDASALERLAAALRGAASHLLGRPRAVLEARLEGDNLLESEASVRTFLDNEAERLVPVASDVWTRSPSPRELSLKIEHDDGRREELYLPIRDLCALIEPLPEGTRAYFDRFDFLRVDRLVLDPASDVILE